MQDFQQRKLVHNRTHQPDRSTENGVQTKQKKKLMIVEPNAVSNPRTVMIPAQNTPSADATVVASRRPPSSALKTEGGVRNIYMFSIEHTIGKWKSVRNGRRAWSIWLGLERICGQVFIEVHDSKHLLAPLQRRISRICPIYSVICYYLQTERYSKQNSKNNSKCNIKFIKRWYQTNIQTNSC